MQKSFFVVVPYTSVAAAMQQTGVSFFTSLNPFAAKKKPEEKSGEEAAGGKEISLDRTESIAQLSQRTSQILDSLFAIGLDAAQLNDEQLTELFYNFYNPESIEKESPALEKT